MKQVLNYVMRLQWTLSDLDDPLTGSEDGETTYQSTAKSCLLYDIPSGQPLKPQGPHL